METTRGIRFTKSILAPYDETRPIVSPLPAWLVVHSLWRHHRIRLDHQPGRLMIRFENIASAFLSPDKRVGFW